MTSTTVRDMDYAISKESISLVTKPADNRKDVLKEPIIKVVMEYKA